MAKGCLDIFCEVCHTNANGAPNSTTCNACINKGYKYCTICETIKPVSEFYSRPDSNGYMTKCKVCYKAARNLHSKIRLDRTEFKIQKNADSRLCKTTKYNTDDAYRIKELSRCSERRTSAPGSFTLAEWKQDLEYFNNECCYCGAKSKLTVDHVVAIHNNGSNFIYNIVPACAHCNSSKCAKDIQEWFTQQPFYSEERLLKIHRWFKTMQIVLNK